jgi:ethanolaminephosphotransferase
MGPKQREMDGVMERLFTRLGERDATEGRKSLIVMVGDHGMTDVSRPIVRMRATGEANRG